MLDLTSSNEQQILNIVFFMVSTHALERTALKIKDIFGSFTIEWE